MAYKASNDRMLFITTSLLTIFGLVMVYSASFVIAASKHGVSYYYFLRQLGFGVAGYLFKKLGYPLAPLVLAIVLGDRAESSFRQAMLVSQGELAVFFSNALVGTMTVLALLLLFWPLIAWMMAKVRRSSA